MCQTPGVGRIAGCHGGSVVKTCEAAVSHYDTCRDSTNRAACLRRLRAEPSVSDTYLTLVPTDPHSVPPETARDEARRLVAELFPRADDVAARVSDDVELVHPEENWDGANCPQCGQDLEDWWFDAVDDRMGSGGLSDLSAVLPCCGLATTLNDLDFPGPAGFCRFQLEVLNPWDADLPPGALEHLQTVLGCEVRQIWVHV
jgi:hypothetical protein